MSVTQALAKRLTRTPRERSPAWHRSSTKSAIMEAARELIARDGIEKTSLMRVAETAGFAPPTVYAYFVRKADLLSALVAEDLAVFARAIREDFPFSPPAEDEEPIVPEPEPANAGASACADDAASAAQDDQPTEQPETGPAEPSAQEAAQAAADAPVVAAEDGSPDEEPVADVAAAEEIVAAAETIVEDCPRIVNTCPADEIAAQEPEGGAPEGDTEIPGSAPAATAPDALAQLEARLAQVEARRADPWLERRLREFERMLSALEERVGANEKQSADTGAPIEARFADVASRLDTLDTMQSRRAADADKAVAQKIDEADQRHRRSWNELRTMALELAGRIEVLERERDVHALVQEMPSLRSAAPDTAATAPQPASADAVPVSDATDDADQSYIAAARRAALAAQTLAHSDETMRRDNGAVAHLTRGRTPVVLAGLIMVGVALAGAGLVLKARAGHAPAATAVHHVHKARIVRAAFLPLPQTPDAGRAALAKGLALLNGDGIPVDDARAAQWLTASARAGDPRAQYMLATLFEHGRGEPADPMESIRWFEASALQGNLKAMYKLAVSYAEGWGTHQNYGEAARWFSRAAEFGYVNAEYNLGVLYERGLGVPQSLLDSYKWYALAAAQGDKDSAARVEALASQLSPEDLATAREAVAAFKPLTVDPDANVLPPAQHAARN